MEGVSTPLPECFSKLQRTLGGGGLLLLPALPRITVWWSGRSCSMIARRRRPTHEAKKKKPIYQIKQFLPEMCCFGTVMWEEKSLNDQVFGLLEPAEEKSDTILVGGK